MAITQEEAWALNEMEMQALRFFEAAIDDHLRERFQGGSVSIKEGQLGYPWPPQRIIHALAGIYRQAGWTILVHRKKGGREMEFKPIFNFKPG